MPLLYLPDRETLFFWSTDVELPPRLALDCAVPAAAIVITPAGRRQVVGLDLPLLDTLQQLAIVEQHELETISASVGHWAMASKLVLGLVAHQRVVPTLKRRNGQVEACWAAALAGPDDVLQNVLALGRSMPPAAHAVPALPGDTLEVWEPVDLIVEFLDAAVDVLMRHAFMNLSRTEPAQRRAAPNQQTEPGIQPWPERWRSALTTPSRSERTFVAQGFAERSVIPELMRWSAPSLGRRDHLRACFRLELPATDDDPFVLRFLLQPLDDPSLLVPAEEAWQNPERNLAKFGRAFHNPQESLLEALGRAARLYPQIGVALSSPRPDRVDLDALDAAAFLGEGAALLAQAGFGVMVPGELTAAGQRRLRLRMRVGNPAKVAGVVGSMTGLSFDALLNVDWQAVLGDETLTRDELDALARQKTPLVRFRGAWIAVDVAELTAIRARLAAGQTTVPLRQAMQAALAGQMRHGALSIAVTATGTFAELLERLQRGSQTELPAPAALVATLRPYQQRGLHWLATMSALGLGACLADDMGLGKTMQLLALLLHRQETMPEDRRPALLVAPTSVIGNWEREIARFAPSLHPITHAGGSRLRRADDIPSQPGTLVLTTYGLLRRDIALLGAIDWSVVALDEAQNIKNAASITAHAARSLSASHRFALTGTPVENRLAELWSILEFANPGILGPLETFRRELALPIERYGDNDAAERLRRICGPFILRRLKSDPTIIDDLPAKNEMNVICTLTREQATLYKAVVDEELRRIDEAEGIERRGRVLALLLYTKQICNHPAQYLGESGPLPERSGKLIRMTEMLEEALSTDDKALVFTQFREMGDRLLVHLQASLGCEVLFLHGGTPKAARDRMVHRFQEEPRGPRIFVLSLKAGGTGLNLTAASHVFHYDRWWNPAVEDQATDRAWRIGQRRSVQVYKLVCGGTVEDRIDRLLAEKRALVSKVVQSGEQWITEMDTGALRELFMLAADATISADADADAETPAEPRPSTKRRASEPRR